jgi:hypothetical protein
MSAEAPKIEASAQGEHTQEHQQQQQHQDQDDQASITSKPGQEGDEATPAGEEKAAKPNPLKKLGAVFKTVFACLRKPAVRDEDKVAAEAKEKDAAAAGGDDDEEDNLKKGADAPADSQAPVIEQGVLSGEQHKDATAPHS